MVRVRTIQHCIGAFVLVLAVPKHGQAMTVLTSRQNVGIVGLVDAGATCARYAVGCEKYGCVNLGHATIGGWNVSF
jgi:hypothetical protein